MARPVTLRVALTAGQRADLHWRLRQQAPSLRLRRRLECIRLADQGWPVPRIAAQLGLDQATIRRTIRRLAHDGLDGLAVAQPGELRADAVQQHGRAVAVPDIGGGHVSPEHDAERVNEQVPPAPAYFLGPVVAVDPPFSAVLTLWLSTIAALGDGLRPARMRSRSRSTARICSQRPSSRQMRQ
jgi:hypothetical protein